MLVSFHPKEREGYPDTVVSVVSFLYRGETSAAEWEPQYGPIQLWERANKCDKNSKIHYVYPFIKDKPAAWSQLAVEREGLQPALLAGSYDYIFSVLEGWAGRQ